MLYEKEYCQLTNTPIPKNVNVIDILAKGLPLIAVDEIARMFDISQSQASLLIGVSIRTVQARKKETPLKTLHLQESDSALQIAKLRNDALEYFGSEQAVNRWMKSVNKGLGDKAPITLCNTGVGRELVRESVNRLKYGMTA